MKAAIVIGATGLVGSELVKLLLASPDYSGVLLLNRRPSGVIHAKLAERIIDFDAPDLSGITGDDFFCALGTTRRKAGSLAAQYRIDCEYPTAIATRLKTQGIRRLFLVSSIGARADATSFYLRTKGQLEENLIGLNFATTVIARPSFLIGRRAEFRGGEEAAILLMKLLSPVMIGALRKYRGIEAAKVARCLVALASSSGMGVRLVESDEIQAFDADTF